jgi:Fe-S cluster assembly ATP-binding protein
MSPRRRSGGDAQSLAGTAILRADGVALRRDGRVILSRVDLSVRAGEVHGLLGPNGSGKSSLAYALMGCPDYVPDEGRVDLAGRDVTGLSMTERARLGLTLAWQEPARFEGLRIRDYLGVGPADGDLERIEDALDAVALAPRAYLNRPVDRTLSGGERKRIELASVFAMRPRVAILDEPDSGIDVLSMDDVAGLIRRMADAGAGVLLITHRDEMAGVADSASLMCQGAVVATGGPDEVRAQYRRSCRLHMESLGRQPWNGASRPWVGRETA